MNRVRRSTVSGLSELAVWIDTARDCGLSRHGGVHGALAYGDLVRLSHADWKANCSPTIGDALANIFGRYRPIQRAAIGGAIDPAGDNASAARAIVQTGIGDLPNGLAQFGSEPASNEDEDFESGFPWSGNLETSTSAQEQNPYLHSIVWPSASCIDRCYRILERPLDPNRRDGNQYDYLMCLNACMQGDWQAVRRFGM